jgi:hypothetical protein
MYDIDVKGTYTEAVREANVFGKGPYNLLKMHPDTYAEMVESLMRQGIVAEDFEPKMYNGPRRKKGA